MHSEVSCCVSLYEQLGDEIPTTLMLELNEIKTVKLVIIVGVLVCAGSPDGEHKCVAMITLDVFLSVW